MGASSLPKFFFPHNTKIWTWKIVNFSSNLTRPSTVISNWTLPRRNICFLHYFSLGQLFCMWKSTDPPSSIAIFHFFVLQNTKEIHVYNTWKIAYLSLRREATNFAFVSVKRRLVLSCKSLSTIFQLYHVGQFY